MFKLFLAELKRNWITLRRYSAEAISGVIGITIVFYGLFLSFQYVGGPSAQFGDRLDSVIVGYVLWSLVLFIISDIAQGLQREAQTGTLEQIFLSPFGATRVFLIRAFASLTTQLTLNVSILLLIMLLTGSRLSFPPVLLLPLVSVLLGAYGLALGMGSLALLLKQVQQLLGIFQFMLFFLLLVPSESWPGGYKLVALLLPMTPGAGLLRELMARGQALNFAQFLVALLNGVVYFGLGLIAFHWAEREAKRRGKLAGY
ncbi:MULTISPECIES: ABC transporter permease [unclassified Leptolyngbya]|uniref:ABC transporter permease n=1 Tax=unclassified Leptolyngbya TaxID=2650499 RepID=UPI001686BD5F|nr:MULTISPECIES: ABC transporter permease [unclassified Leptolyngbya]MBD1909115.1 ABC transporter permease [Leptolyngbya sp. FACHB-8]MBD2157488.1 ABC transporter permease [Leptolyngbya sp. FACHB-16]